jgi:CheY-like chemotaxis protein
MDLQMPIMDGYEATKIIRESDSKIPIIALTANAMKEDVDATKKVGMNEHLNKPIDVEKLYKILLRYISKKEEVKTQIVQEKEEVFIPSFKNIDTKIGLSHLGDNKKLYLKVLNDFKSDYENLKLQELNDEDLKRVAHTLKGLSANLGIKELSKIAGQIEKTLDKKLFSKLYEELNIVLTELEVLNISNNTNSSKEKITSTRRDELFLSLKEYASKRRAKGCKEVIEVIEKYSLNNNDMNLLRQIKELLQARKYKEIVAII